MSAKRIRLPYRGFSDALLYPSIREEDLRSFRESWKPYFMQYPQPDDHWDWSAIVRSCENGRDFTYSVSADGETQGLMWLRRGHASQLPLRRNFWTILWPVKPSATEILIVERLASAPWNRIKTPGSYQSQYSMVGTILLREAVLLSKALGLNGRVGLTSLKNAERFYEKIGMIRVSISGESLAYFEFDPAGAEQFLKP